LILIRRRSRKIAAKSHPSARTLGWLTFPPRPTSRSSDTDGLGTSPTPGPFFLCQNLAMICRAPAAFKPQRSLTSGVCSCAARQALFCGSRGDRTRCSSVIRLPQSFACQRSLVEVRPAIPVCILVGSVGLCVQAGLRGASDPWRSSAAMRILRGSVVVQTSLVPSREYTLQTVRFRVSDAATMRAKPRQDGQKGHVRRAARLIIDVDHGGPLWPSDKEVCPPCYSPAPKR
jgi:hypothetical protein